MAQLNDDPSAPLSDDELNAIIQRLERQTLTQQQQQFFQQRLAQAQSRMQEPARPGGGFFGQLADNVIRPMIAGSQASDAQKHLAMLQALSMQDRAQLARMMAGGGNAPPQAPPPPDGIPELLRRPGGSVLPQSLAAARGGAAPEDAASSVSPEAGNPYAAALRGSASAPRQTQQDFGSQLRKQQAMAMALLAYGNPAAGPMLANSRDLLKAEMERGTHAAGQQETGRHNLAMEGIDRDKLAQDQWTHVVDPITDEAYLLNKRTGMSRPLITEQPQGAAGSGQGPNGAPAIPTDIPIREPGEAPAPTAPSPTKPSRAQQIELHQWKKLAPETRKRIEDTQQGLQNIRDSIEAAQKYPGAFGVLEQPSDVAPGFSIGGVNPMAALGALMDAPARAGRNSQEDEARATVLRYAGEAMHTLSGAAVTPSEATRFRAFIPNANDSQPEILSKLRSAEKIAAKQLDKLYRQNGMQKAPYMEAPDRLRASPMVLRGGKRDDTLDSYLDSVDAQ